MPDDPYGLLKSVAPLLVGRRLVFVLRFDSDPNILNCIPRSRWPFFRTCQLPYVMPGYIGRKLGGDELAYCFGEPIEYKKGQQLIPGRAPSAQPAGRMANGHPCSRALDHFKWLVRWWSNEKDIVCDLFAGSCTTGRAAKDLNRKCICIEIEEKYAEIGANRMKQEVLAL